MIFIGCAGWSLGREHWPAFPVEGTHLQRYAEELGLRGIRVDDPGAIADAWDRALSADRPTVVEAVTDPNVPPLPPHIKLEQAKKFATTLLKGDPDEAGVIMQTAKQVLGAVLPGKK